jgi:hypothetical protein
MTLPAGSAHTFTVPQIVLPAPPSTVKITGPTVSNNEATWTIFNIGGSTFTINQLCLNWPSICSLQWVKLNGNIIFNGGLELSSDTVISSGWQGSSSLRSIGSGQAVSLTVHAAQFMQCMAAVGSSAVNTNPADYVLSVQ